MRVQTEVTLHLFCFVWLVSHCFAENAPNYDAFIDVGVKSASVASTLIHCSVAYSLSQVVMKNVCTDNLNAALFDGSLKSFLAHRSGYYLGQDHGKHVF